MALPIQIDERLRAVGVHVAAVEEKFVRGTGRGGRKIEVFTSISTVLWPGPMSNNEQGR